MRNLVTLKACSICLMVLAAAACREPAGNDAAGNQANAAAENEMLPLPEENIAAANSATPAEPARSAKPADAAAAYEGFGTEPYWTVTIANGRMRYQPADGTPVSEPLPARTPIANGYRYAGTKMTVEVVHRPCNEAGEDTYPDEVRVRVGSEDHSGCGGSAGERG